MTRKTKSKPSEYDQAVGARLKELRDVLGYSQTQVGQMMDPEVVYQQVSKIELGINRLSAGNLIMVCSGLGISVADFVKGVHVNH